MTSITISKSGFIFKLKIEPNVCAVFLEGSQHPIKKDDTIQKANRHKIINWAENSINEYLLP